MYIIVDFPEASSRACLVFQDLSALGEMGVGCRESKVQCREGEVAALLSVGD